MFNIHEEYDFGPMRFGCGRGYQSRSYREIHKADNKMLSLLSKLVLVKETRGFSVLIRFSDLKFLSDFWQRNKVTFDFEHANEHNATMLCSFSKLKILHKDTIK